MEPTTLQTLLASFVALPITAAITAVFVTRRIDHRREKHARRMDVFRTLMRTRRVPMSADHVGALNLVEIEFTHDAEVMAAWRELFAHFVHHPVRRPDEVLMSPDPSNENPRRNERFDKRLIDDRRKRLAKLLHAMACKLGYKHIEQLDIFEGGYSPQGWEDEYAEQQLVRRFLVELYAGRAALPVISVDAPRTPSGIDNHTGNDHGDRRPQ